MTVRTRMAPSPTGFLHVGSLRTGLYNYLFAKKHGGSCILRVEDTDRNEGRWKQEWEDMIFESFADCGIEFDEDARKGGEYGPYRQSERLGIYQTYIDYIKKTRFVYEDTDEQGRKALRVNISEIVKFLIEKESQSLIYSDDGGTRNGGVRIRFFDEILGEMSLPVEDFYDFVIVKSDGYPTFQFANAVDDHTMSITHVMRGNEHIQNTYMQILFYEIFGWEVPKFAHLNLQLEVDRSKMSKRKGAVSVEGFIEEGYLPQALINFVFLLGFAPSNDQEIFTIDEMMQAFDLSRCNKSNSIFDREKLKWMNGQYIKSLENHEYFEFAKKYASDTLRLFEDIFGDNALDNFRKAVLLEKEKVRVFNEIPELLDFYVNYNPPANDLLHKRNDSDTVQKILKYSAEYLRNADFDKLYKEQEKEKNFYNTISLTGDAFSSEIRELYDKDQFSLEEALERVCQDLNLKRGEVFWAVRVKLTGRQASPGVFEVMNALGEDEVFRRLLLNQWPAIQQ
jgi:glutamyl/glutaminyl-tRNA synthetase